MRITNSTALDTARLSELFGRYAQPYRHEKLSVAVRYSRGADFSGTCYYNESRIYVNLGRRNRFPYALATNLAKARTTRAGWRREMYVLTVPSAYELILFVFLHELYHYLVKSAGRAPGRKEAMCDRFAARALIDDFGCSLRRAGGGQPPRESWDFQDLDAFVARARKTDFTSAVAARRPIPVRILGAAEGSRCHAE